MSPTTKSSGVAAFLAGASVTAVVAAAYLSFRKKSRSGDVVSITLPDWLSAMYKSLLDKEFTTNEEMVSLAVEISSRNVSEQTGGPFGCAIYERDIVTGRTKLFSVGANRVTSLHNSTTHAEMVAIQFGQKKLQSFTMNQEKKEFILCTSCEPCAMCLGGTFWSGVSELICAATKDDAEAIGFDEGPVFPASYTHLEKAGIKVKKAVKRADAAAILKRYGESGVIYNG